MERDAIWHLLSDIQSQIRVFDLKAQVALGIDGILAGFLGAQLLKTSGDWANFPRPPLIVASTLLAGCFACLIASFAYALRTIHPRLNLHQPYSRFFFAHIAERHGRDYESAARDLVLASGEALLQELGTQVSVNSIICDSKAHRCRRALFATSLALSLYLVALIPLSISEYEKGIEQKRAPTHVPKYFQTGSPPRYSIGSIEAKTRKEMC